MRGYKWGVLSVLRRPESFALADYLLLLWERMKLSPHQLVKRVELEQDLRPCGRRGAWGK